MREPNNHLVPPVEGRMRTKLQSRVSSLVLVSCVAAGCAMAAGKADYRDYRTIQTRHGTERMFAMRDYLARHPDGRWAPEIREERESHEPSLFEASKSTAAGLRFYLEAYPQGRFVSQAEQRLAALSTVAESRQTQEEQAAEVRAQQREDAAEQRRLWGTKAVTFWSRTLLGVQNWGRPIPEVASASEEFNEAFGAEPRPHCNTEECIKFYHLDYYIPVPGRTRMEKRLSILLRLRLEGGDAETPGNLVRAEMLMPRRGFSRWYELENQQFVVDEDPEQRQQVIAWALERIIPIIREIAPTAQGIDVIPEPIDPPTVRENPVAEGEDEEAPEEAPEEAAGELVLPLALHGLRVGNIKIVVFAAADDDLGVAYDGLFLELSPEDEEAEAE